jgi:adenylate kinase
MKFKVRIFLIFLTLPVRPDSRKLLTLKSFMKMFNLILFGPPGSGKGTQSVRIAEKYRLVHISTGDILRKEVRNKTGLGLKVQGIMERGELVPDELLIDILREEIHRHKSPAGYIFDGFPRTVLQADELDKLLKEDKTAISLVLALDVNQEEVIKRLLKRAVEEGRKDDTEEVIRNRMNVYRTQTQPLIDHYKKQGKFRSVMGIGSIDDIFKNICSVIDKAMTK